MTHQYHSSGSHLYSFQSTDSDKEQSDDTVENIFVEELWVREFQDNFSTHTDQVSVFVQEHNLNQAQYSNHKKLKIALDVSN